MDQELKIYLGRMLSEIYFLQNQLATLQNKEIPNDEFVIYHLGSHNEYIINQQFGIFNNEPEYSLSEDRYFDIAKDLDNLNPDEIDGFYSLPADLREKYSMIEWIAAIRVMRHEGRFGEIFEKIIDNSNSPWEINKL